jgi:hypothetical protein
VSLPQLTSLATSLSPHLSPKSNQGLGASIFSAARTTTTTTQLTTYSATVLLRPDICDQISNITTTQSLRQSMRHEPSRAQEAEPPNHKPIGGRGIPTTGCALTIVSLVLTVHVPTDRPRHRGCECWDMCWHPTLRAAVIYQGSWCYCALTWFMGLARGMVDRALPCFSWRRHGRDDVVN